MLSKERHQTATGPGAARADVCKLGPHSINDCRLRYHRPSRLGVQGMLVDIPVHTTLAAAIANIPQHYITFLQTSHGKTRSASGLGNYMKSWCIEASLPNCTSFGLRRACEKRIQEAGHLEQPIAAVLGYVSTTTPHKRVGMSSRAHLADTAITAMPSL